MSRNLKTIIIMLAGIVLMAAVLIALSCDGCGGDAPTLSDSDITSGSSVSSGDESSGHMHHNDSGQLLVDKEELTSLRMVSNQGDYMIRRGNDGLLAIESLSGLKQETDFLEVVWYNSLAFGYSYFIHPDEETKLSDFGLDPAVLTLECAYTDGSSCRVFVGNQVPGSPNIYYFMLEGHEEIFINEFDSSYFLGDSYWLSDDIFGDDVEDVTIGTVKLSGSLFPREQTLVPNSAADHSNLFYGYNYVISAPQRGGADNYLTTLLCDELTEMVADDAVLARPGEEDISRYGLDRPHLIVTHQRNGEWKTLRVAKADASTMYAMADGVDCIFRLSADSFLVLSSLTPEYLRSTEVHVRYFDSVHTIRIQAGDTDYTFRLDRTPLVTDETLFEYWAYYGDTQLTLNYYRNLLEVFNRATAISYDGQRQSDTPAMTVSITFFNGFERKEEVIRYYPAGTRRYLVEIDGAGDAVVSQMWVDKLLESAHALSLNQEVTP